MLTGFIPVTDESLKMLLSRSAWFIQRSEGATGRRKGVIIPILQLRKQKKAETLWHVHLPHLGKWVWDLWRKILLLPLQITLSPEQLYFTGAEYLLSSAFTTMPKTPQFLIWFSCIPVFFFFVSLVSIYFLCIWMLLKATDIEGYTYSWRNRSLKKCTHLLFIIHDSLFIIHFFLYS